MTALANRPIIIKRKKVIAGGGHHGGAWKVAYADFVTAMMAFFMLMWLLNATTEQQRKGIADYFSPTIPINRISGGGDGALNGESVQSRQNGAYDGTGGPDQQPAALPFSELRAAMPDGDPADVAGLRTIETQLMGIGGESLVSEEALRHVVTRLTDEGLVIEVFSLPDVPIFRIGTAEPEPITAEILAMIARLTEAVANPVAVAAYLNTRPVVLADNPVWDLSVGRAGAVRAALEDGGIDPVRMRRQTGHADHEPLTLDPSEPRNERIEIILLREVR